MSPGTLRRSPRRLPAIRASGLPDPGFEPLYAPPRGDGPLRATAAWGPRPLHIPRVSLAEVGHGQRPEPVSEWIGVRGAADHRSSEHALHADVLPDEGQVPRVGSRRELGPLRLEELQAPSALDDEIDLPGPVAPEEEAPGPEISR